MISLSLLKMQTQKHIASPGSGDLLFSKKTVDVQVQCHNSAAKVMFSHLGGSSGSSWNTYGLKVNGDIYRSR